MPRSPTAQEALLDEFASYYNADELPRFIDDQLMKHADDSAARLVHILGEGAADVAVLLREMAGNIAHPLHETIGLQTMYHWNGDPESWGRFQRLAWHMADRITTEVATA